MDDDENEKLYEVYELMPHGTLLHDGAKLSEDAARPLLVDVLLGVEELHAQARCLAATPRASSHAH